MGLIDLLFVVAAILVILWLVGLVVFALGPLLYILLVLALVIIIFRLVFGRRL
jgi:hypothetical protein